MIGVTGTTGRSRDVLLSEKEKTTKEEEEAKFKKLRKEKSTSLIGQSIVQLTRICMPKCMNMKDSKVERHETECLKACV